MTQQQPAAAADAAPAGCQTGGRNAQQELPQQLNSQYEQEAPAVEPCWQQPTAASFGGDACGAVPGAAMGLAEGRRSSVNVEPSGSQLSGAPGFSNAEVGGSSGKSSKRHMLLFKDGTNGRSSRGQWQRLLQFCCGELDERVASLAAFAAFMALSHTSLHAVFPSFVRVRTVTRAHSALTWTSRTFTALDAPQTYVHQMTTAPVPAELWAPQTQDGRFSDRRRLFSVCICAAGLQHPCGHAGRPLRPARPAHRQPSAHGPR